MALTATKAVTPAGSHSPSPRAADRRAAAGVGGTALPIWLRSSLEGRLALSVVEASDPMVVGCERGGISYLRIDCVGGEGQRALGKLRKLFDEYVARLMDERDAARPAKASVLDDEITALWDGRGEFVHAAHAFVAERLAEHGDGYARKAVAK